MSEHAMESATEETLAVLAAQGDDAAMSRLITLFAPVARARAAQCAAPRISDEDLTQEGMIGLIKAVYSFDPAKGVRFRTYACTLINNEIYQAVRVQVNQKNRSLTGALPMEYQRETPGAADPAEIADAHLAFEQLQAEAAQRLSPFEHSVLELRLRELPRSEIAARLGCDVRAVDNAIQRIRQKLRNLF